MKIRCGVPCAHEQDVHDCQRCSTAVVSPCEELCVQCPLQGLDSCGCPRDENGNLHRLYIHDCQYCIYLGRFSFEGPLSDGGSKAFLTDLYACPTQVLGPSLIARYSSDGPDYTSYPFDIIVHIERDLRARPATTTPGVLEALRRWRYREERWPRR